MDSTSRKTPEDDAFAFISPIGYSNSSDCGYCRRSRSGFSYYATASSLSPEFYQKLLDRCWRRSGTLLYRPNQRNACCPHYTLRLDSSDFRPSKDQRQTVNRFNRYVAGDEYTHAAARLYPRSREQTRKRDAEFELIERIHEGERDRLKSPPEPAHDFVVTLEPDDFTEEKYGIYENYQRVVHGESPSKISRSGFKRFLCRSPLKRDTLIGPDGQPRQLGSFHQCYRLDGKLVAIGVLDLLPQCVSAVYFLYHESVHKHNPGKLGALREVSLALEGGYRYWYSGYYIHSCPKMRYKIDYSPQYVLDPESLEWYLLDKATLAIFDKKHYVSLYRDVRTAGDKQDDESFVAEAALSDKHGDDTEVAAAESDNDFLSLFQSNAPGIMTLDEIKASDIGHIAVRSNDGLFYTSDLVIWDEQSVDQFGTLKFKIGELIAAIGTDLMSEICLDFRRGASS